jgi:hypothetical protein
MPAAAACDAVAGPNANRKGGRMHAHSHTHPDSGAAGDEHSHGVDDPQHEHHHHRADTARPQHVVLDIGEGVGALIVHTDPGLLGTEVEISPADDDWRRSHKEVLERTSADGGSAHVLVFDDLPEGLYTLWLDGYARSRGIAVRGGEVAELDWRGAGGPAPLA